MHENPNTTNNAALVGQIVKQTVISYNGPIKQPNNGNGPSPLWYSQRWHSKIPWRKRIGNV